MFNVKIDKFNIQFTFSHVRNIGQEVGISDVTLCTLKVNDDSFTATAACSLKDVFNKEVGRKVALARVLKAAREKVELPHVVRDAVWARYFGRWCSNKEWVYLFIDAKGNEFESTGTLDEKYTNQVAK